MKKIVTVLSVVLLSSLLSFTSPLSLRMERLVDKVEADYENWDKTKRKEMHEQYQRLLKEYNENYENCSQKEKDIMNGLIGRYNGLIAKYGLIKAKDAVKDAAGRIPQLTKGFVEAFE